MKFFTVTLLVLTFSLESLSASLNHGSVKSRGLELCPSAVAVNSATVSVNGHEIQRTTFECPDDSLSARAVAPSLAGRSPVTAPNSISEISQRSAAECETAAPECQCGQPTTCTCISPTPLAPNGNDCTVLIDALKVLPQVSGPTFIVQTRTFELVQFESCAMEWSNLGLRNGPLEYCWDEAVALAGLTNEDCLEAGVSTGASCTPSDDLWNLEILRIGS